MRVFASADGAAWDETPLLETRKAVNVYAIPEPLRRGAELHVRVKSFGFGADTCVGGFALCK